MYPKNKTHKRIFIKDPEKMRKIMKNRYEKKKEKNFQKAFSLWKNFLNSPWKIEFLFSVKACIVWLCVLSCISTTCKIVRQYTRCYDSSIVVENCLQIRLSNVLWQSRHIQVCTFDWFTWGSRNWHLWIESIKSIKFLIPTTTIFIYIP